MSTKTVPFLSSIYLTLLATVIILVHFEVSVYALEKSQDELIEVIAAFPENFPPNYMISEKGKPTGFAIEVMDQIALLANIKIIYKPEKNFADAIQALQNGSADLIPNSGITPDRLSEFDFSLPVDTFEVVLFTRKTVHDVKSLADLKGRNVGVVHTNVGEKILKDEKEIIGVVYDHVSIAIVALLAGHIDAIIYPKPILQNIATKADVDDFIQIVGKPLLEIKRGIRVRKGDKLLARLNPAVETFLQSKEYKDIYVKWFGKPKPFWSMKMVVLFFVTTFILLIISLTGWRYKVMKNVNEVLQENLSLKEQQARILKKSKQDLEDEVKKKTAEIVIGAEERKKMELLIYQQEKLASIGQLAAGIAHEINNPIGFIASNLNSLKKYVKKITDYINASAENLPAEELQQLREKLKINFITEDVHELIDESIDGTERVKEIVQNLKVFSRVNEVEYAAADINTSLDNTLKVIWNELKYKTKIIKEYGELPLVECHPQQLSQVFMNLLINASHAIETQGEITIKTWSDSSKIFVSIADTGSGIAPEQINKLFEPFYTTKEVGQGTGLGLSIAYEIIQKHNGKIDVESEVGKGTKFTVSIPFEGAA